jgi:AraC-like DNA-binding protein
LFVVSFYQFVRTLAAFTLDHDERRVMDPLAEVLSDLRLARSFYARAEVRAPWGLAFSIADGPSFHFVVAGNCWLRLDAERIPLGPGDLALLPNGEAHQLAAPSEAAATPLAALPSERIGDNAAQSRFGGSGEPALLICCGVGFAGPIAHPLVELLPRVLLLRREAHGQVEGQLGTTLNMLGEEALSLRPGTTAIMTRLADVLVLQAIRAWLECDDTQQSGWIAALRDPEIGRALALMHRRAEEPWTVATLASEVHLSRSIFSDRFTRRVGTTPMRYLTRWRMSVASSWIRDERMPASEAALRLGYSSEAAFSRAFKRHLHMSPSALRRGR